MAKAADALLASLDPEPRRAAIAPFDTPDHRRWSYFPGRRPGLALDDMPDEQQALALELLETGCSPVGAETARAIMSLYPLVGRNPDRYWVRVLGPPGGDEPWAWRVNAHHLALHLTVVGDAIAVTPQFFGTEPAVVQHGPHRGLRPLPGEEERARALLASLDPAQRRLAVSAPIAPRDILTRFDPIADPNVLPSGLAYGAMTGEQRDQLRRLVRVYFDRVPRELADASWHDAVDAGLEAVTFRWAGPNERGAGHYYAVSGPTFLIEYDNTQDNANHIHSVWRDLRYDWGEDLLAAHYAADRH
ncbi:MAG: DUF3500 domain-containing protein [Acidimicrobiales bacterium]